MRRLLASTTLLFVTASQVHACDKARVDQGFQAFFKDTSSSYDRKFIAMTAESARKYTSALDNLTDVYKEYFAKDAAALSAIYGCDKRTIVDAALRGAKE
ncbi:MAG: hypothetical protein J0H42_11420 [Rhizobiales bacterium]|nr:hypothetical protein [Hyphomicrobiales bacterium]